MNPFATTPEVGPLRPASMNSVVAVPGLKALYWRDLTIKRAVDTVGFMLLVAAGFRWAAPTGSPPPGVDLSFEIAMAKWVPVGAIVIAALALIILMRRHLWVKAVLTQGVALKGKLEDVDVFTREDSDSENTPAFQRSVTRSYYVTLRYLWRGADQKVRLKLPNSPYTYGLSKGRDVDLIVLDSAPHKPLIRSVYLGR